MNKKNNTTDREIVISRTINATRDRVFRAWTNPEELGKWWGPNGFTITTYEISVKKGGVWKFMMHGPDGTNYPNKIVFTEILNPERIIYEHFGEGDTTDAHFYARVTFEEVGQKTKITMHSVFQTKAARDHVVEKYGAIEGGKQHLGRLEAYLQG